MNAVEIEAAVSELARQPFDRAEFPFAFLAAFGNKETTLRRLRKGDSNTSDVPNGVLQRANIHIAVCEPGRVAETLKNPAVDRSKQVRSHALRGGHPAGSRNAFSGNHRRPLRTG